MISSHVEFQEKFIYVRLTRDYLDPKVVRVYLPDIIKEAELNDLNLIVHRNDTVDKYDSIYDCYGYVKLLAKHNFTHKLALVFPREMQYHNLDFFIHTSFKQGINSKLFSKIQDAIDWVDGC